MKPNYIYVASSWRNPMQPAVCATLRAAGIDHYDFKNPEGGTGFSWREVKTAEPSVTDVPERGTETGCALCGEIIVYESFVGLGFWEPDVDSRSYAVKWRHKSTGWTGCDTGGTRFATPATTVKPKGSDWERVAEYLAMVQHPRAIEGFTADFDAMKRADAFVLVLPCGKSAHLELGWAVGAGKRTAILLEDPVEPELMYRMVDYMAPSLHDLLGWLGVD